MFLSHPEPSMLYATIFWNGERFPSREQRPSQRTEASSRFMSAPHDVRGEIQAAMPCCGRLHPDDPAEDPGVHQVLPPDLIMITHGQMTGENVKAGVRHSSTSCFNYEHHTPSAMDVKCLFENKFKSFHLTSMTE